MVVGRMQIILASTPVAVPQLVCLMEGLLASLVLFGLPKVHFWSEIVMQLTLFEFPYIYFTLQ